MNLADALTFGQIDFSSLEIICEGNFKGDTKGTFRILKLFTCH